MTGSDRLLIVAPHPDDETLATGTLLQRGVAAGAIVRVVFVTSGDNNPWAQRAVERRWRIGEQDRRRFGGLREGEALAALGELGVGPDSATFLRFPDQGLTDLLLHRADAILRTLLGVLAEVRPTLVVYPSLADLHPDHSAVGVLLRVALRQVPEGVAPRQLTFLVHHPVLRRCAQPAVALSRSADEVVRARHAVAAHRSQRIWRGGWMAAFLGTPERFFSPEFVPAGAPLSAQRSGDGTVCVTLRSRPCWRAFGPRTLVGAMEDPHAFVTSFALPLRGMPANATLHFPARHDTVAGMTSGSTVTPAAGTSVWFLKLERRFGFFDEGGWIEVPPPPTRVDSRSGGERA